MMNNYISPEIMFFEFDILDVLTNSSVVTTNPGGSVNIGGSGGDGYIDFDDIP
ncbi:MAG: hypothetical protein IKC01_07730 [Clostridia bacterium]|nr:hypothetical protein [Clostridia bacterium]